MKKGLEFVQIYVPQGFHVFMRAMSPMNFGLRSR